MAKAPPRTTVISYQGTGGAYSETAAANHFGARGMAARYRGYHTFAQMLQSVASGECHYGVLPIENTTAGSINEAYDLLARMNLFVIGEEVLRVQHCLLALPGVALHDVRRVFSHPQALAQCSEFLSTLPDCTIEAFTDTAMSVERIAKEQDRTHAAVASERAAKLYGLKVLKRDIANQKQNYTRFMVVATAPVNYDADIRCKTSLIFTTRHEQGALVRCLNTLARAGLSLTKLESRPRLGSPFEYVFYVDFEGNQADPKVRKALQRMVAHTTDLKVLGSYPARTLDHAGDNKRKAVTKREAATERKPATKRKAVAKRKVATKRA